MLLRYKNDLIYLVLISIVVYIGSYFVGNFFPNPGAFYRILCHVLLVINAGVVFFLAKEFTDQDKVPLLLAAIYLIIPSHLDFFLFTYQIQLLFSEFFLLISFYGFFKNKDRVAFFLMAAAIILNAKLIVLYGIFLYCRKSNVTQKIFIFSHVLINIIFYEPYFRYSQNDLIFNPRNVFYGLESLFSPVQRTILDMSLLIPTYYDRLFLIVFTSFFLLVSIYYFNKKILEGRIVGAFVICSFLSTFIPMNYFSIDYDNSIYTSTNAYPLIPLAVLLLLLKLSNNVRSGMLVALVVSSLWVIKDFQFQNDTLNVVSHWKEIIYSLPESFNNEEKIKLTYVNVLIENREYEMAEKFVNQARYKFPNENWYNLAQSLAARRQDQKSLESLQNELYQYKIPFHVD